MAYRYFLIPLLFAAGYFAPTWFKFEPKMEFAAVPQGLTLIYCPVNDGRCQVDGYHVTIKSGQFSPLERTEFELTYEDEAPRADVLVTSDDQQFGTLIGQPTLDTSHSYSVLIPYCTNSGMQIIIIDPSRSVGLLLSSLL